jgi:hypothetical protein
MFTEMNEPKEAFHPVDSTFPPKDEFHHTNLNTEPSEVYPTEASASLTSIMPALMMEALEGENREHQMGMWAAARSHPRACLWAFIMCFTIVSLLAVVDSSFLELWCLASWRLINIM